MQSECKGQKMKFGNEKFLKSQNQTKAIQIKQNGNQTQYQNLHFQVNQLIYHLNLNQMQKVFIKDQRKSRKRSQSRGKLDQSGQLRKSAFLKHHDQNIYDVIIIGAGISGLLAAQILLRQEKTVLVLEGNESCGGSIVQKTIGEMIPEGEHPEWMKENDLVKNTRVEIGTSELTSDHHCMIKLCQQLDLSLTPMYSDGKIIYAQSQTSIKTVLSRMDIYFCPQYKKTISKLLAKIQNISKNIIQAHSKIVTNPGKVHYLNVLKEYIDKFDNMTVRDFFTNELHDQNLRNMVFNQFQIVQSIQVDKVSIFLVFLHKYGLENLALFTQIKSYLTQTLRIKQGNMELIHRLQTRVIKRQKKNNIKQPVLRFNEKVLEIKNEINREVEIITNKGSYKCFKVFFSATMDSAKNVRFSKLSDTKRMILENQEDGNLQRAFLIFQTAFWRSKFSGTAVFSQQFPVSEMVDFSPSNLCCGILCLVFCGSKIAKWSQMFAQIKDPQQQKKARKQYLINLVAKMYLNGDRQSQHLRKVQIYIADQDNYCYQTYTKLGIADKIQKQGQDYLDCYIRDEHNIIFLGSELSKKFGSYMEGAVRHTREQIYRYLEIQDPWGKL